MIFVSTFLYTAAKLAGDEWEAWREKQTRALGQSEWPGLRTVGQVLQYLGEPIDLYMGGNTLITKSRCHAAGFFLRSKADVWLTVDDDIFAAADVCSQLVTVARHTRGMVAGPAVLRSGKAFNFHRASGPVEWLGPCAYAHVDQIGFGIVAIHRDLVEVLARRARTVNPGPDSYPALFLEDVDEEGTWIGEDVGFCHLAHKTGAAVHMLCNAAVEHCGRAMKVSDKLEPMVQSEEVAKGIEVERLAPHAGELELTGDQHG